jgi:hypothetical protein
MVNLSIVMLNVYQRVWFLVLITSYKVVPPSDVNVG